MNDEVSGGGFWSRLPVAVQAISGLVGAFAVLIGALAAMGYFSADQNDQGARSEKAAIHKIDPSIIIDQRAVLRNGINVFVYLRAHPSYVSDRVASVGGQEVFLVGRQQNGWIPVRLKSGNEGWIELAPIQIIDDIEYGDIE